MKRTTTTILLIIMWMGITATKSVAQPPIKHKAYTYATLGETTGLDTGTNDLKYEYTVGVHTYKRLSPANNVYLVTGDKFKIEYDSLSPVDAKIIFEEPVFAPTEKLDDAEGTLKQVHPRYCMYVYYHHNVEYRKIQYYYQGTVEKYNLKKGDKFDVNFVIGYPARAIIFLDRPVK